MGYEEGKGLGRHGQGRTEIVEASKQRGRRGLGLSLGSFEPSDVMWKFEDEEVTKNNLFEIQVLSFFFANQLMVSCSDFHIPYFASS